MSTSGQPLKLNYAKGRQKSKTKNQLESQQKIALEGQSSTDIFSHLNQDNLNYIKKELKHKKASQSQQKGKILSLNSQEKSDFIKTKNQEKEFKMYQRLKNFDQVKQKDSKEELKKKNYSLSDSIMAQSIQQTTAPEIQKRNQKKYFNDKQKSSYQGLQPPPLTYTTKQKQIPSSLQNQDKKQKDFRLPHNFTRNLPYQPVKNNFLEYELKSQTSNNQLAQSSISQEKQTSQNLSLHEKGSQFIGYLQSYIQELNSTAAKKNLKVKESSFKRESENKQIQKEIKNFRKIKQKDIQYQQVQSGLSEQSPPHRPISVKKIQDSRNIGFQSRKNDQRASFLYSSAENKSPVQRKSDQIVEQLKKQLQKQKYYCTKLALELQKYKQNETKNQNQIMLLQKTIDLLKIEVENVKQLYQNQVEQTQKILTFFQMQKQKDQQNRRKQQQRQEKKERQLKMSRQKYNKQPQLNFRQPIKSFNESYTRRTSIYENQFEEFMRFKDSQKTYNNLNPRLTYQLKDQFQKGKQAYNNQKQTARINHSHRINEYSRLQKYFDHDISYQPRVKRHSKYQDSSDKQQKYLQNLFKLNHRKQQPQRKRTSRLKEKQPLSSSSQQQIQRQQSSLEKLKREYELFKVQAQTVRFEDKKYSQRNSSLKNQISPKQFSHIYVK